MTNLSKPGLPGPVAETRRRLDEWRRSRRKRGPMPMSLWEEAAQLAHRHGVSAVARALRLDYYALKCHLGATRRPDATTRPAFVEVAVVPPAPSPECIVEMERPDGARMRVRLSRSGDLAAVTESFWRCRA